MTRSWSLALSLFLASPAALPQQATPAPASRALGVVSEINSDGKSLSLKTDAGATVTVELTGQTAYMRVPPGETTLKSASKITLQDVTAGDRVLARGAAGSDASRFAASSVIVMSQSDLARKQEQDREAWTQRGITGVVTAVDATKNEITLNARSREGMRPTVVTVPTTAKVRRYAPESIRFADAKPSSLGEIKVGDQVRALGKRSEDGAQYAAEELVAGTFRNIAGTVLSVNAVTKEIRFQSLDSKQPVVVKITSDTSLRRVSPEAAEQLAMMNGNGAPGAGARGTGPAGGSGRPGMQQRPGGMPADGSAAEAGAPPRRPNRPGVGDPGERPQTEGGPRRPGGPGMRGPGMGGPDATGLGAASMQGRGGMDVQQTLERAPSITLADLKQGDALIIATTGMSDPAHTAAITVVAGVEPLLTASSGAVQQMLGGSWTLDMPQQQQ